LTAWLRGDIPTELTSNHLSSVRPDRLVEAGGTLINLIVGIGSLVVSRALGPRANIRYFFWLLGALNLLPGAGYFLFSGIIGFGDWNEVIRGLPHHGLLRVVMTLFGAVLYVGAVRALAITVRPFAHGRKDYNTVGRLPYYAACLFECVAGVFDPMGIKLLLVSTIPAAFGGSSGLMWADSFLKSAVDVQELWVRRQIGWWVTAVGLGGAYVAVLGPGIRFAH
jgi:hypothetical protein